MKLRLALALAFALAWIGPAAAQFSSSSSPAAIGKTAWTPTDQSGAALTFTTPTGFYYITNGVVYAYLDLTYPSNANAANGLISTPVPVPNFASAQGPSAPCFTYGSTTPVQLVPIGGTSTMQVHNASTSASIPNSTLSTGRYSCTFSYPSS